MLHSIRCTIRWNSLNFPEWENKFLQLPHTTLLQSYPYAQSICAYNHQRARWGIIEINGEQAGLVQIFEVGLLNNVIHAVMLDRGPLWFDGYGTPHHKEAFFDAFNRTFPRRLGRKRRIIPEISTHDIDLSSLGYQKMSGSYETIILDLQKSDKNLRSQLKKNWRGSLKKAERSKLDIEWDEDGKHLAWFIQSYAVDKAAKNYDGPSTKLLKLLARYHIPKRDFLIGRAVLNGKAVAGILILCHGHAATYQIGFTSPDGRDEGAHHLLLWNALSHLKQRDINAFDLGGINDKTAKGIQHFKTGMGGEKVQLAGIYR